MIYYLVYFVFAFIIIFAIYMVYLIISDKKPEIIAAPNQIIPNNNTYIPIQASEIPFNNKTFNATYNNDDNSLGTNTK